jgi:RNA polymerase sigma-70 factor (ECF subfamily)
MGSRGGAVAEQFRTTQWSVVLSAARGGTEARAALDSLCRSYWYPLYAYVRRRGHDAEAARDLTQAFFASLLEREALRTVDPSLGKFRAFLLASMKNFLSNQDEHRRALKRRADDRTFQVDLEDAEGRYFAEPAERLGPEELFETKWARIVLDRALRRLREEYEGAGKGDLFRRLRGHLTGDEPDYDRLAEDLDTSKGALRVAVHRLRRRLGTLLRDEVGQTVSDTSDVDAELRSLLVAAGRHS